MRASSSLKEGPEGESLCHCLLAGSVFLGFDNTRTGTACEQAVARVFFNGLLAGFRNGDSTTYTQIPGSDGSKLDE